MQSYNTLKTDMCSAGILRITLHRPDKLNALNHDLLNELNHIISQAKTDIAVKALLITGEGHKAFCAGADISGLADLTANEGIHFARSGQKIFRELETLSKPSLAAINGFAFGGGCELAMAATMRIASTNALFAQPEVKLGIIPGYGGTQRLSRLIGKGRALDLCLTGRSINAEEALSWGLISEIVTIDNLLMRAQEILQTILAMAPLAVSAIMQVINAGYDLTLKDALELEALHFGMLCATTDKKIGVNAFLAKQKAAFTGK